MAFDALRRKQEGYLPLTSADLRSSRRALCTIPFGHLAWSIVSLPLVAFIFCVMWSVAYHFESTVSTHCRVDNLLPSISAAIGAESPQIQVWQIFLAVHAPGRFLVMYLYQDYFLSVVDSSAHSLVRFIGALSFVENWALLGLSFFSSSVNYSVHEKCFMTFIATSELYMVLCCYLLTHYRSRPLSNIEARSLVLKKRLLAINISSFVLAGIFFVRHNSYCEPYVYTFFAGFEYVVVLTNMAFHMTAFYDLYERRLHLGIMKSWIT